MNLSSLNWILLKNDLSTIGGATILGADSNEPSNFCLDHVFVLENLLNMYKYLIAKQSYEFYCKFKSYKLKILALSVTAKYIKVELFDNLLCA